MQRFDYIKFRDRQYQTTDTPGCKQERYEIKSDYRLYRYIGNQHKHCSDFTGTVNFYRIPDRADRVIYNLGDWQGWQALVSHGCVLQISEIVRGR
jgi:hypothetical protein